MTLLAPGHSIDVMLFAVRIQRQRRFAVYTFCIVMLVILTIPRSERTF